MTKFVDVKANKGNNSCITEAIPTECKIHQCFMVIYISYMFHRIPFIDYLVTAENANYKLIQGQ